MNLYHFTVPENALLIGMGDGLKLDVLKIDHAQRRQTMGQSCVWLTQEESNAATAADIEQWTKAALVEPPLPSARPLTLKVGEPRYGGPVRCQVFIERHNKKLVRWLDFLRTTTLVETHPELPDYQVTGCELLEQIQRSAWYMPEVARKWWVYFGEIPNRKIGVPLTRAQAIEGCDWHVEKARTAEAREQWKQQRETFASTPDDALFLFENGECRMFQMRRAA